MKCLFTLNPFASQARRKFSEKTQFGRSRSQLQTAAKDVDVNIVEVERRRRDVRGTAGGAATVRAAASVSSRRWKSSTTLPFSSLRVIQLKC